MKVDLQEKTITRLSCDKRPRPRAGRPSWPISTRLNTRSSISWPLAKVDFVGRATLKSHVWSIFIVPVCKTDERASGLRAAQWHRHSASEFGLHRENQPLYHGNATVLSDCAIAWRANSRALDPTPKWRAVENAVSVADDILGPDADSTNQLSQKGANSATVGPVMQARWLRTPSTSGA